MRLLLDTSVLLWWFLADRHLGRDSRRIIDSAPDPVISPVSVWEISIKRGVGKLSVPEDIFDRINTAGFRSLPVGFGHAVAAGALPPHHRDPFDRMLVAQAQTEGLTILTSDRRMHNYDVAAVSVS